MWDEGREVTTMHDPNDVMDDVGVDELDDTDDIDELDVDEDDDFEDENDEDGEPETEAGSDVAITELVDLVRFMVSALVEEPETLEIRPERFGQNVHIKIIVPEEDMGRVIGRQGRIARSMRTLLTIAASRKGLRASLDIDS
jgi:uncharacterized protein